MIPLEKLFDQKNKAKDPKMKPGKDSVEDKNIGIESHPKVIKMSKKFPAKEKEDYVSLMRKYTEVFAWIYEDIKEYNTSIIQHTIPINLGKNPFKQKLRRANPKLFPIIEKEIRKLFDAKIIVTLRFSRWVANVVPVRKKNGDIWICVDFRNLNTVYLKDNYPLPNMEHLADSCGV